MGARHRLIDAVDKVPPPARLAAAALTSQKTNPHPLADLPMQNTFTQSVNFPHNFVTWNARKGNSGQESVHRCAIRMADAAGLDPNSHLPRAWFGNFPFNEIKFSGGRYFDGSIFLAHTSSLCFQHHRFDD